MGTRSITTFISTYKDDNGKRKNQKIVTMYRQYDGYPSGHGVELAEFLADGEVINGYGSTDGKKLFNGIGCLTAQVVAHFKDGVGNIYIEAPRKPDWEDYAYEVIVDCDTKEIVIKVIDVGYESPNKTIFKGTPKELVKAVQTEVLA